MTSKSLFCLVLVAVIAAVTSAGCRSTRPPLPPPEVLATYAPRPGQPTTAESVGPSAEYTSASAASAPRQREFSAGSSSCTSGCCSNAGW